RELQSVGAANILAGAAGSPVGFHAVGLSLLSFRIGARGTLAGLLSVVVCALMLFFGPRLLSLLPASLIGGLLIFLGLSLLLGWVWDGWFKLTRADYSLVILIMVVLVTMGFLPGVAAGLIVSSTLFLAKYSRVNVIKQATSGVLCPSNVSRSPSQQRALDEEAKRIYVLKLHGFIFFGTAYSLLNQIRDRVEQQDEHPLRYIVLDFRLVTGLDSSAVHSFSRMLDLAKATDMILVMTHLSDELQAQFDRSGFLKGSDDHVKVFPDLDHGLEWCEDELLLETDRTLIEDTVSLEDQLQAHMPVDTDLSFCHHF
ncbi:MAG: STAS domain-containing protein, partial [Verrucomicrobiota bacterium]